MTTDARAVLAAALGMPCSAFVRHAPENILAALDGWTLVPTVATADWTGSTKAADAVPDAERLRIARRLTRLSAVAAILLDLGGLRGVRVVQDVRHGRRLDTDRQLDSVAATPLAPTMNRNRISAARSREPYELDAPFGESRPVK